MEEFLKQLVPGLTISYLNNAHYIHDGTRTKYIIKEPMILLLKECLTEDEFNFHSYKIEENEISKI